MIQLDRIEDSQGINLDNTDKSKECKICHYNYFDDGFKSDSKTCYRCDWGIKSFGNFAIIHVHNFSYIFFMFDMTEEDVIEFIKDFELEDKFEKLLQHEGIGIQKELTLIKQMHQKNVCFVIIGILKILNLNFNQMSVINVVSDLSFRKQKTLQH